jgi:hypothetical protein
MADTFDEPPIRGRYESRKTVTVWPFAVSAVLVAGIGTFLLTQQAYAPPYLQTTTGEALATSAVGIAIRVLPLVAVVSAGLYFGLLRRAASKQAPEWAAAIAVAGLIGSASVVILTHLEKEAYVAEGRPEMAALLQRTADRYENEVLLSHGALNSRMRTVLGPGFLLWSSYRSSGERDYDRLRRLVSDARTNIDNHRSHIADQQAETIDRIRVSRISRFGKAEAIADLRARFEETRELRERHFTLFSQILDEVEAQVGQLEQADGRWEATYFYGVTFRDASVREAFNARSERITELADQVNEVTEQLTVECQRVRADAYDRAVAEREAEQRAGAATQ